MNSFAERKTSWEETQVNPVVTRFPERQEKFATSSGIPVDRVYGPAEVDADYDVNLGFPASIRLPAGCSRRCTGAVLDDAAVCGLCHGR